MTDECISPLRQRMLEDMSLRFGRRPPASVFAAPSVIGRHPKPLYGRGFVKTFLHGA